MGAYFDSFSTKFGDFEPFKEGYAQDMIQTSIDIDQAKPDQNIRKIKFRKRIYEKEGDHLYCQYFIEFLNEDMEIIGYLQNITDQFIEMGT